MSQSGGIYTYDIDLSNTGTTNIGTFWFAWVPGEDFLPSDPTSESAPTGWNVNKVTHNTGSPPDGYAIRWEATTPLAAGKSIDGFQFSTPDSYTAIQGDSPYFPGTPVLTSFVYEKGPFQGGHFQFQVTPQPAPEPSAMIGLGMGAFGLVWRKRKR